MFLTCPYIDQAITPTTTPKDSFLPGCKRNGDCSPTMWEFVTSRGNYWLCYFKTERGKLIAIREFVNETRVETCCLSGSSESCFGAIVSFAGPKKIPEGRLRP